MQCSSCSTTLSIDQIIFYPGKNFRVDGTLLHTGKLSSEQHTNHSCRESLTTMKSFILISLLALLFVEEATSTHLETCNCNEIRSIVNESIEDAVAKLENKLLLELNSAITNKTLQDMESSLTSTMERLLKPIQEQLNYHLPPAPPNSKENPAKSCKDIYSNDPDAVSGYYWIKTSSGSPARVYCKMNADCQNMTGGWMRVAYIDMRNSSHQCPSGLNLTTRSSAPRRLCDMPLDIRDDYVSNTFTAHGISYSHVYGRIKAYQYGLPSAFSWFRPQKTLYSDQTQIDDAYGFGVSLTHGRIKAYQYGIPSAFSHFELENTLYFDQTQIDDAYGFGVSLTHGQNPRKHIWTCAGAEDETLDSPERRCPCTNSNLNPSFITIPSFVGNDYFCDTALGDYYAYYEDAETTLFSSDPLWDGEGCGSTNTCCSVPNLCGNNSPPWFIKHLPSSTTDDVEMRLCHPVHDKGSTPIEIVELYVQ